MYAGNTIYRTLFVSCLTLGLTAAAYANQGVQLAGTESGQTTGDILGSGDLINANVAPAAPSSQNGPYYGGYDYRAPVYTKPVSTYPYYQVNKYPQQQYSYNNGSFCSTPQVNDWMYRRMNQGWGYQDYNSWYTQRNYRPTYQYPTYTYPRYQYPQYTYSYPQYRSPRYTYPQYRYPSYNTGANRQFANGIGLGNGIGHIVTGSRYNDDFETAGGVLTTVGSIFNIISDSRNY